jgi:hypothetical protein
MRRTTAILTVCLCAAAGCRGSAAQEPYDGVIVTAKRPGKQVMPPSIAAEATPMASEVDVPFSIALLSNAKTAVARKASSVVVVEADPEVREITVEEVHIRFAIDPGPTEEKPAAPKACTGVVKTRS